MFLIHDPHGNVAGMDSVGREDIILDSFNVEHKTYSFITRAIKGQFNTEYESTHAEDKNGNKQGGAFNAQMQFGMFQNVSITMSDKEEIDSAWRWLHGGVFNTTIDPAAEHPAWTHVRQQEEFIAKVRDWKRDINNHAVIDVHRRKLIKFLSEREDTEMVDIMDKIQVATVLKRNKEMKDMNIGREYFDQQ